MQCVSGGDLGDERIAVLLTLGQRGNECLNGPAGLHSGRETRDLRLDDPQLPAQIGDALRDVVGHERRQELVDDGGDHLG
jgi:hypothetical protein